MYLKVDTMGCFDDEDEKCGTSWETVDRGLAALGVGDYRLVVTVLNRLSSNC